MRKAIAKASAAKTRAPEPSSRANEVPWRERLFLTTQATAVILGVSVGTVYRLEKQGKLIFKRFAGKTLIETATVIALAGSAEEYVPLDRADAARARRSELAREAREQ